MFLALIQSIAKTLHLILEVWQLNYYNKGIVHHKYYGEQNYVNWKVKKNNIKLTTTPKEWLVNTQTTTKIT